MKVLNMVLSVLILLLAVASAVFAYFLFEKREQMTLGWKMMARAIHDASATLDKDAATTYSSTLTEDNLSHLNYDQLTNRLRELQTQAAAVVKGRDQLATSLLAAGNAVNMTGMPANTALTNTGDLSKAEQEQQAIIAGIKAVKTRYDDTVNRVIRAANAINAPGTADFRDANSYSKAFDALDSRIGSVNTQLNNLRSGLPKIAAALNTSLDAVNDTNFDAMIEKVRLAAANTSSQLAAANDAINNTSTGYIATVANLNNQIDDQKRQLNERDVTIQQRDDQIRRLIAVIDPSSDSRHPDLWEPGALEARRQLQGRVLEVNDTYGIIIVDLGKNTRVYQRVGQNRVEVDPKIPTESTMAVLRGEADNNPEYIGRIKLIRINENCSVAEAVRDNGGTDRKVRPGDIVIFTETDLASLPQQAQ